MFTSERGKSDLKDFDFDGMVVGAGWVDLIIVATRDYIYFSSIKFIQTRRKTR